MAEPADIIRHLWERTQARDWAAVGELLAEDVVVEWPVSGERILGRDHYVRVNAEYPEGWTIHVLRIVASGTEVVSEVEVHHETMGLHRAASFWTVRDGRIVSGREYWTEPGSDPSPEWRAPYVERVSD
ncbi:nuclear transport factor 2 family protein [Streptomyces litchfieldiae]|uniref:Nuclear transport factor 2 family protein n=1 Tax=Streptomyces litchfieldiae TaxID=3075543 RepID=A0ABU2ML06_9ACTN|nr:nuclear transport factor 2 family protein [Streptomyces sp. DSM 44938]MDT0342290.1 nuclear transport factor 2 family protein [Streptomyces sp. DSM 44938]